MKAILGIWDGHNASASLVIDGRIVAAVAEERLTRRKMQRGFPTLAVAAALRLGGLTPGEVTRVTAAGRFGRAPLRLLDASYASLPAGKGPMAWPQRLYRHYENALAWLPGVRDLETRLSLAAIRRGLAGTGFPPSVPLTLCGHHAAHAASAATMFSNECLAVTMDGYGDGEWASLSRWDHRGGYRLGHWNYLSSVAITYGAVCQLLGYGEGDEGKVTALAAAGKPRHLRGFFREKLHRNPLRGGGGPLSAQEMGRLHGNSPEDIAAGMQAAAEEFVVTFLRPYLHDQSLTEVALAGGLFANVAINRQLVESYPRHRFQVFPAMSDQGLSLGAAVHAWMEEGSRPVFPGPFIGCPVESQEPDLAGRGAILDSPVSPELTVARALAAGQTVALVHGREEFGPRALGNRSLLFAATSTDLADRVQSMLGRDPTMPFAPACREAAAGRWLSARVPRPASADLGLGCMTFAVGSLPETAQRYPAAIHVDGTARVQVVTSAANPRFYRVLEEYERISGEELLINTSFNLHGDPIVHDVGDALDTFSASGVDLMWLEDHLVKRSRAAT